MVLERPVRPLAAPGEAPALPLPRAQRHAALVPVLAMHLAAMLGFLVFAILTPDPDYLIAQTAALLWMARLVALLEAGAGAALLWQAATKRDVARTGPVVSMALLAGLVPMFLGMLGYVYEGRLHSLLGLVEVASALGIVLQAVVLWLLRGQRSRA